MSLFNKFKIGLGKSSTGLTDGFKNIFSKKKINEEVLKEFEELIISSDAGVDVAKELRKDFENLKVDKKLEDHKEILKLIAEKMAIDLLKYEKDLSLMGNAKSSVIVVFRSKWFWEKQLALESLVNILKTIIDQLFLVPQILFELQLLINYKFGQQKLKLIS